MSSQPLILSRSVSRTFQPFVNETISCGFAKETLIQLILHNPMALASKKALPGLKFWRIVFASEEAVLKIIKTKMAINLNVDKRIIPRINLLREYGLSDSEIAELLMKSCSILFQKTDCIKQFFKLIEKLGFLRGSKMFLEALAVVCSLKRDTFDKKVAFFKTTYGWSEKDVHMALRKYPRFLLYSEELLRSKIDFLITKVGIDPRSIASCPILFWYSLEKRLIPRHYVVNMLKLKGIENRWAFRSVVFISDKQFVEKYILPYKEELPGLEQEYTAACAGKISLS